MPMSEATSICQRVVMPQLLPDMRLNSLMPFDMRLDREGEVLERARLRAWLCEPQLWKLGVLHYYQNYYYYYNTTTTTTTTTT